MNKTGQIFQQAKLGASSTRKPCRSVGMRGASLKLSDLICGVSDSIVDTSKQTEPRLAPLSFGHLKAGTKVSLAFYHDHYSESFSHYVGICPKKQNEQLLQNTMNIVVASLAWSMIRKMISKTENQHEPVS
tara:strand:- start:580 stop:972 length:393 start_codon:yes stop_codon:yes gene_type:complete